MDLLKDSVPKSILRLAVPASIGYFFNTMYNFVDTFWAGRLSTTALAALSLSFPVFIVIVAFGSGVGAGMTGIISNLLGKEGADEGSNASSLGHRRRIANSAFSLSLLLGILIAVAFIFALRPLLGILSSDEGLIDGAWIYAMIIGGGAPFLILNFVLSGILTAHGDTKTYRNFLIIGFIANVILDPLLMFGLSLGDFVLIPPLEIAGVALATVLIQFGGVVYLIYRLRAMGYLKGGEKKDESSSTLDNWREIAAQSFAPTFNMLIMAAGSFVITYFIAIYGPDVIAAYGSALRIEQIALIPTIGLNAALAALAGQNNGAGNIERVKQAFLWSLGFALVVFVAVLIPVVLSARYLMQIFTSETSVIDPGVQYLRIQLVAFFSYIIIFQSNSVLQGVKRTGMIFWTGLFRQVPGPLLVFPLFSIILGMGIAGIWWGIPVVNWIAALWLLIHVLNVLKQTSRRQRANSVDLR